MWRRTALANMFVLPALAAGMIGSAVTIALADSKTQLKYQLKPHGGQQCSGCALFTPGKSATANGTCTVISGAIGPQAWCTAFIPKSG